MSRNRDKKIRARHGKAGDEAKISPAPAHQSTNHQTPIFDFHHISREFLIADCHKDFQAAFARKIYEISRLTWDQLGLADYRNNGYESLDINILDYAISSSYKTSEEFKKVIVFRFLDKGRIVGHRYMRTFHVLFVDDKMRLYNHGS